MNSNSTGDWPQSVEDYGKLQGSGNIQQTSTIGYWHPTPSVCPTCGTCPTCGSKTQPYTPQITWTSQGVQGPFLGDTAAAR